jgi:hypothetical protein
MNNEMGLVVTVVDSNHPDDEIDKAIDKEINLEHS